MKTKTLRRLFSMLAALVMGLSLLTGCSEKNAERTQEQEDAQTIQVYLWSTSLYENYAPYVQAPKPSASLAERMHAHVARRVRIHGRQLPQQPHCCFHIPLH